MEVIISTIIVGILATGLFSMASLSGRLSLRMQQKMTALSLIEKKVNDLRVAGVAKLPQTQAPETVIITSTPALVTSGSMITVVQDTVPADPKMKEVKVSITWKDPLGFDRTESAVTAMYQG